MTNFTMDIANHIFSVAAFYESTKRYCSKYLTDKEPEIFIEINKEDLIFERKKSERTDLLEERPIQEHTDAFLEITAVQRKIAETLFDYNVIVFHGSVVAVEDNAYLFTAKSGTGKSTHSRLWREIFENRAIMVNDDKPFIEVQKEEIYVYGSPWNGKHRLGENIKVPLKAICILNRGEENKIVKIAPRDALQMIFQQSNRPLNSAKMSKYMELIDGLISNVDLYRLECNMDPSAAILSYETMSGKTFETNKN